MIAGFLQAKTPARFYWVSLDWHSAASHLAFPERLRYFTYLCSLQIPDLYSDLVKRGANKCYTKLRFCKPLCRHNLRCSIYRVETKLLSNNFLHFKCPITHRRASTSYAKRLAKKKALFTFLDALN